MSLTYSLDLARFVVASLVLEKWGEETHAVDDETIWNGYVALAERYHGEQNISYIEGLEFTANSRPQVRDLLR